MQPLDLLVVGLTMAGVGAIGAALFGAMAGALKLGGGQMAGATGIGVVLGAAIGLLVADPSALPSLGDIVPKFGAAADDADMARVLKAYYPNDWAQVQTILAANTAGQAPDAQTEQALRQIGAPLMERQLPLASTENVSAFLALTRDEQKVLMDKPDLCLRVMTAPGPETTTDMVAAMPDELKAREARLAIAVLEQTATHPQAPHPTANTDQELTIWARDAYDGLSFDERDALHGAGGAEAEGKAYCKMLGNLLYTLTFDYPPDATEVYKSLIAKGVERMQTSA
jgi:hypothetical protein